MNRFFRRLVLISMGAVLLAACGPTLTPAPAFTPIPTIDTGPANSAVALIKGWVAAFKALDGAKVISFYSQDAEEYDADFDPGFHLNYSAIVNLYQNPNPDVTFDVTSYFVSGDGRFAAIISTFADWQGVVPSVSLLEFKQGQIVWQYDYYGGKGGRDLPVQAIPESANQPDPLAAAKTQTAIAAWKAAFSGRDAASFLSFYADLAQYTDVVDPQWRVYSKPDLEKKVATDFANPDFKSTLGNFFVSADGRFAAVQGVYKDLKTADINTVVILEMDNGKIRNQFNYLIYRERN